MMQIENVNTNNMKCPHFEQDVYGDICHADIAEECPYPFNCTAIYNCCGELLRPEEEESGLDRETYGFY